MYISGQGGGGFAAKKLGEHAFGGPAAHRFTGHVNSDIENGELKPSAAPAQLYDLSTDAQQKRNVIRENPQIAARMKSKMQQIRKHPSAPHAKP